MARTILFAMLLQLTAFRIGAATAGAAALENGFPPITSAQQFLSMGEAEKAVEHRVRLELVALYYDPFWRLLWARDGNFDTYIPLESLSTQLRSGQRFLVEGSMVPSKGLRLATSKITVLEESAAVPVLSTEGRIADTDQLTGHLVDVAGYVNRQMEVDPNHLLLELDVEGQPLTARVLISNSSPVPQVEGAFVRLTGVYIAEVDPALPLPKLDMWVPTEREVKITGWLDRDKRFELPVTPIDALPSVPADTVVRVMGLVRSQVPGTSLILRDETGQLTLKTAMTRPVKVGERVEAIGHVALEGAESVLHRSFFRRARGQSEAPPVVLGLPLLRLIEQVRNLKPEDAARGYEVRLRGSVIWSHPSSRLCFVQDASGGIAVELPRSLTTVPEVGMRVVVTGTSHSGDFAPVVQADQVDFLDLLPLPEPRPVTLEHALTGVEEGQWVTLSGYVRAAAATDGPWTRLDLTTSGGEFSAWVPAGERAQGLTGSAVKMKGVCTAETNAHRQLTGIRLLVSRNEDIEVEAPKLADPFSLPLRTITSLRQFSTLDAFSHQVRVTGVVLNQVPGASLNLQEGNQGLLVLSRDPTPLMPGDRVEAVGLPGRQSNRVVLREAVYRKIAAGRLPAPLVIERLDAMNPDLDGRLVEVDGTLLDVGTRRGGLRLICQSGELVFEALLGAKAQGVTETWRAGSKVALTGVYEIQFDEYSRPNALQLHVRSSGDVRVLRPAAWWTARRALIGAGILLVAIVLGLIWVVSLQHRVREQTQQIRAQMDKARSLEAELFRSSKLESLGVLAGGIAHDFNNLLTVVMGNISLVLSDRRIDPEATQFLRDSERAALRARDLTQQLLTFSKGGAPVRSAVLLPDVVREAAGFALHGSNVRCNFDFAEDIWPADADKGQVAQVVHNIVINAVQAMPTGGVVDIHLRNDRVAPNDVATLPAGRYLKLTIADAGAGISAEHLSRIFDPYFTTKQRGSGLGLATVYSIVKKHAGHLDVRSTLGRGTTFDIWLPAADSYAVEPAVEAAPVLQRSGRALVMDDEPSIRAFMTVLLERIGLRVTAVGDGAAAVRAYEAAVNAGDRFALVVLDLTVPAGMGGAEAMEKLRTLDAGVCAIVSSGYSKDPVVANYRAHGFRATVPKPYNMDDVIRVVSAVLPA